MKSLSVAVCISMLLGTPSYASLDDQDQRFATQWLVKPAEAEANIRTVGKGEYVLKQKLLAPSAVEIREAGIDTETGKTLLPVGAHLFGLVTSGPPIFCLVGAKSSFMMHVIMNGANRAQCFIDTNNDGRFDGHFSTNDNIEILPMLAGKRPEPSESVRGGSYVRIDPATLPYFVGIRHDVSGKHFSVRFGNDEKDEYLANYVEVSKGDLPRRVSVLGAVLNVTGVRGNEIDVEIERPIPQQPFNVRRGY